MYILYILYKVCKAHDSTLFLFFSSKESLCQLGLQYDVVVGSTGRGPTSKPTPIGVGRIGSSRAQWTEGYQLAAGWRHPQGLAGGSLHMAAYNTAAGSPQSKREQQRVSKMEATVFL